MAVEAVPPRQVMVTCPRCAGKFNFDGEAAREKLLAVDALQPEPAPAAAPPAEPVPIVVAAAPPPEPPPVIPAPPPLPRSGPVRPAAFSFTGTARDYFGIWIVNALLKIITLGGYSAWAKVRTRRYLYGCTKLQGNAFDYVADPMALFRGWLIGALLALLYMLGSKYSPSLALLIMLVFTLGMPWLIVRSRMFSCRNTTYRNIRFAFAPNYREAYEVFLGLGMLLPFTLGLLLPYVIYRQKKFLVENCSFGATAFTFNATAKDYYRLFFKASLGLLLVIGAIFVAIASLSNKNGLASIFMDNGTRGVLAGVMILGIMVVYFFFAIYVQTAQTNLAWSSTQLGRSTFSSELATGQMAWLYLSNVLAIACSLGLLVPWALIRITRYRLGQLSFLPTVGLDTFLAGVDQPVSAVGEEVGEIFGVDVGL
jgi:uncharacterized membrane protein YjgN (DUF898 family)